MASTSDVSHPVVFSTQTPYTLPSQKFMIPASWKRYHLSQLVNKALSLSSPIPFDFLVRGEILRTSLGEWSTEKGIGEEETLEIEYFESVMPPQRMSSLPHEDWVSSVSCGLQEHFVTASYDGILRVFDYSQTLLHSTQVHEAPITSFSLVHDASIPEDDILVATASHDLTARLTQVNIRRGSSQDENHTKTLASLHLHTAPLSSISSSSSGAHIITASWDSLIGVWDTLIPASDEVPMDESQNRAANRKKRRKVDEEGPRRKAPLHVLKGHTARVSKASFATHSNNIAYSASFDSTLRAWDVENGVCTNTITASTKPFLDLAVSREGTAIFASSSDRTVSQYDIRDPATSSSAAPVSSFFHPATPSCISLPPSSSSTHQFVTGSYDGVVRLWDTRSVRNAVTSFKPWEGGKKILSVDWGTGVIAIGGEGGVEIWRLNQG